MILDRTVHRNVAHAAARAAHECGIATTTLDADYYGAADLD